MPQKDEFLDYPDGTRIRYRMARGETSLQAVYLPGLCESLDCCGFLPAYFARDDIALHMLELRGHGLSSGMLIPSSFAGDLLRDARRLVYGPLRNQPVVLVAQGLSAVTALGLAADARFNIRGLVLISPMLFPSPALSGSWSDRLRSRLSAHHAPHVNRTFLEKLSNDDDMLFALENAQISQPTVLSFGLFQALTKHAAWLLHNSRNWQPVPRLITFADEDPLLDMQRSIDFFTVLSGRNEQHKPQTQKKNYHSLLLGRDRIEQIEKISRWLGKLRQSHDKPAVRTPAKSDESSPAGIL